MRTVDAAQYENRTKRVRLRHDGGRVGRSRLSPGNEQRDFWGSVAADTPGSRNLPGINDPVVDELIELVIAAPGPAALVARTRALDRVLLWGHYVIPHWHLAAFRVAYWDKFGRPPVAPKYALGVDTWWVDPGKEATAGRKGERPK